MEISIKLSSLCGLVATIILDKKIEEIDNKVPDASGLVNETGYDAKIIKIKGNTLLTMIIINLRLKLFLQKNQGII